MPIIRSMFPVKRRKENGFQQCTESEKNEDICTLLIIYFPYYIIVLIIKLLAIYCTLIFN